MSNFKSEDATIQVVAERINSLHEDVTELRDTMKESVREMSSAIQALVRLEERQFNLNQASEQLRKDYAALESRVDSLEKDQPDTKRIVTWAYRATWAALAVVGGFILKAVGLM